MIIMEKLKPPVRDTYSYGKIHHWHNARILFRHSVPLRGLGNEIRPTTEVYGVWRERASPTAAIAWLLPEEANRAFPMAADPGRCPRAEDGRRVRQQAAGAYWAAAGFGSANPRAQPVGIRCLDGKPQTSGQLLEKAVVFH